MQQLDADDFGEQPGDDEEQQGGQHILNADHLVIDREDVSPEERGRRRMQIVKAGPALLGCDYGGHG